MAPHYRMRVMDDLAHIGRERWDALAFPDARANPFLRYDFLSALHETGCADANAGWQPQYLTLWDESAGQKAAPLLGAVPLYVKNHSYGEYVFDWAWADAYERNGLNYYPKLLAAVPFTPVEGPRLLGRDPAVQSALAEGLVELARQSDLSSLHVLFPPAEEAAILAAAGMMRREGVQFHWTNRGYASFEDFLGTLERKKRKNIRAERRHIAEAGVTLRRIRGADATAADWRFFTRCYQSTYRAHYSSPYLNLAFFQRIGRDMPENLLMVVAERAGERIASSLVVYTPEALYGRYWGAVEHVPLLHFECAYYQPLEFCIEEGIARFEGGAQGEHKMARGFLPVRTHSAHWLAHPAFADAIETFLKRENAGIDHYLHELDERNPFKAQEP